MNHEIKTEKCKYLYHTSLHFSFNSKSCSNRHLWVYILNYSVLCKPLPSLLNSRNFLFNSLMMEIIFKISLEHNTEMTINIWFLHMIGNIFETYCDYAFLVITSNVKSYIDVCVVLLQNYSKLMNERLQYFFVLSLCRY